MKGTQVEGEDKVCVCGPTSLRLPTIYLRLPIIVILVLNKFIALFHAITLQQDRAIPVQMASASPVTEDVTHSCDRGCNPFM